VRGAVRGAGHFPREGGPPMKPNRRDFLKAASAAGAVAAVGALPEGVARSATPPARGPHGMARGLTLLTLRKGNENHLGVRTDAGVIDVKEAAARLKLPAPATLDDLLQHEDGPNLNALVAAVAKSGDKKLLADEKSIEYGPLVSRPEKIVCVGLNYKKHA